MNSPILRSVPRTAVAMGVFALLAGWACHQTAALADAAPLRDAPENCDVGSTCSLEGKLYVHSGVPASVAELQLPTTCYALSLPASSLRAWARKRGISAHVTGRAYSQEYASGVISIAILDRQMATGFCSDRPAIYVDHINKAESNVAR